ncbi:hypothetical protein EBR43_03020 [bacterium]|nr:hypothetical protein [bacterium]NBX71783.1 hypothetical protein [bacterium]
MIDINSIKDKILPAMLFIILTLILTLVIQNTPPSEIIIEAGPKGGFFDSTAIVIANHLEKHGIKTKVITREDTIKIIDDIEHGNKIDIGFMAQDLGSIKYHNVEVLGSIIVEPIFIYVAHEANIKTPTDLIGKRIATQPVGSGSQIFCDKLYDLYGVNQSTAEFKEMSFKTAIDALESDEVDAICVLQPITNSLIKQIGKNSKFHVLDIKDNTAILGSMPFTNTMKLPKSAFSFVPNLPENDTNMVGIPVSVLGRLNLHPGIIRLVSQALFEEYSIASAISKAYEFPDFREPKLFTSSVAREVYKNPRSFLYTNLNFKFAATLDLLLMKYGYLGGILFFMMAFYSFLGFPKPYSYWCAKHIDILEEKIKKLEALRIKDGILHKKDELLLEKMKLSLSKLRSIRGMS